jgi:histidyl-tRNA synthetase
MSNYLCAECKARFEQIKKIQANLGNIYKVDPYLTKNFAYYNGTVFDFVVKQQDNELVVGDGGRYDYLSERLTGRKIPAIGFHLDLDLIFQLMEERNLFLMFDNDFSVYIYAQSPELEMMVLQIAQELHSQNIITVLGTEEKPEDNLKQAQAHKCDLMITLREENIREGKLLLYNLEHNEQTYIPLNRLLDAVQLVRKTLKK